MFAFGDVEPPFSLFTTFPRAVIPIEDVSIEEFGITSGSLLTVECDVGGFDPVRGSEIVPVFQVC